MSKRREPLASDRFRSRIYNKAIILMTHSSVRIQLYLALCKSHYFTHMLKIPKKAIERLFSYEQYSFDIMPGLIIADNVS